jgi:diguanylate cyclase (GGDEF)-like protein/PAS domain S-box-containing protein
MGEAEGSATGYPTGLPESVIAHALSCMSEGSVIADAGQTILFANDGFATITGYTSEESIGLNCRFLQGVDSDQGEIDRLRAALVRGETYQGTVLNYRKNGDSFWNELTISPIPDDTGRIAYYASVQRDVSERVALESRSALLLQETVDQEETARLLIEVARTLGQRSTLPMVAQKVVDALPRLTGADRAAILLWDEAEGRLRVEATKGWDEDLGEMFRSYQGNVEWDAALMSLLDGPGPVLVADSQDHPFAPRVAVYGIRAFAAVPIRPPDAPPHVLVAHWVSTPPPDSLGETTADRMTGLAGLAQGALDITVLVDRLSWEAEHDGLTGLPNRALLERTLTAALEGSTATGVPVGVLFCDIHRLRRANDSLGHRAGDEIVRQVAARLRSAVDASDMVARVGGDEFVVVLPGAESACEAERLIDEIGRLFDTPVLIGDTPVFVRVSTGLALSRPEDTLASPSREAERLISRADSAMYRTKRMPRSTASEPGAELRLDADLRGAVRRGEIVAHYQPQVDLASGRIVAVEALARWRHPELGLLPPDLFIPIAEENGLIAELGQAILHSACHFVAGLHDRGLPVGVAVNASAMQLASAEFFAQVEECLAGSGLAPDALTVEITESHLVEDPVSARGRLQRLRDTGVEISIDDFGTGYSSLTQLLNLPVSELKIDRSFVQTDDATGAGLVAAVVGLSRGLGYRVVAEGIETDEQLQLLRRLGVDRGQGHALGRPMEADRLVEHLLQDSLLHAR